MPPAISSIALPLRAGQGSDECLPRLHEVLTALSFALDLTEGAVQGHALRSCLLAQRLAAKLGLPEQERSDLYYATLLKDAGCSSNAARVCQIVGGDDRAVKAGVKLADWTRPYHRTPSTIQMFWKEVLPGAPPLRKLRRLMHMAHGQHTNNRELFTMRCDRGANIALKIGFSANAAAAVRHLDEHWDGSGYPHGLRGTEIPLLSRLMSLAQHLDAFCQEQGPRAALDVMMKRKGRWFDPKLAVLAWSLEKSGELWRHCESGAETEQTHAAVLDLRPAENNEPHRPKLTASVRLFPRLSMQNRRSPTATHKG